MSVVRGCESPSVMRLEFDVYPYADGSPHLWVAMDMQCPPDDFDRARRAMHAVIQHLVVQLRNATHCPYHPVNQCEGMADGYHGA